MSDEKKTAGYRLKRKNFASISGVLPRVLRDLGLDKRLKEHTFLNLWPHIVGEPFGSRARPLFIDSERNLVVAVQDASVGQEMGFHKTALLAKLKQAAIGVGIDFRGMRFDMKRFWEGKNEAFADEGTKALPIPSKDDLQKIQLSEAELGTIAGLGIELSGGSEELVRRMRQLFELELRVRHYREANGYPHCGNCGDVTERLHGTDLICSMCFSSSMSIKGLQI